MPRLQMRAASIVSRLVRSLTKATGVPASESAVLPGLIVQPLAALGLLACGKRFALPPNARLLVVLTLLELRQEPGLLTLLLEALQRALEGLVGLHDDLGHSTPPLLPLKRPPCA